MTIAREIRQDRRDERVTQAWLTAALSRAKKLPALESLLRRATGPQTVGQQRAALEVLSAQYGIPLRKQKQG